jgi:hypothetical protein
MTINEAATAWTAHLAAQGLKEETAEVRRREFEPKATLTEEMVAFVPRKGKRRGVPV